ncbi:MAG: acyl carrier protein [Phycisphaerales bacterium]
MNRSERRMGLEAVELVMAIEEDFGVTLPDRECQSMRTVGDLAALVVRHLPKTAAGQNAAEQVAVSERVLERVRQIISQEFRLPMERVQPHSRLIQDLGID